MKGVAFGDRPQRIAPPPLVDAAERKPAALPTVDLKALEAETAQNIKALGQLLHGVLFMAKVAKIQQPESRLPAFDTHLAHAVQLRADLTARLLAEHAAKNEALLRILQGFNGAFKGGDVGQVAGSLVCAGLATVGRPAPGPFAAMLIPDVMQAVH
ncbi:MAG: hypothetical protein ACRDRL_16265, partial [Sciscionella sp.]